MYFLCFLNSRMKWKNSVHARINRGTEEGRGKIVQSREDEEGGRSRVKDGEVYVLQGKKREYVDEGDEGKRQSKKEFL